MTRVYFVRHAKPDFSVKDDLTRPLTEEAIKDCEKIKEFLLDKTITKAFSSPYKRAVDTIKSFAESKALHINVIHDFRERKVGDTWVDDFDDFAKKQWENFDYKLPEGESLRDTQSRNIAALMKVLEESSNENIIIGSHGTAISTIINHFNKEFGYKEFDRIKLIMPFIVCLTFEGKEITNIEEVIF